MTACTILDRLDNIALAQAAEKPHNDPNFAFLPLWALPITFTCVDRRTT